MKNVQVKILFLLSVIALGVSGCQSFKPIKAQSKVHKVMLDYQGSAGKIKELPDWVSIVDEGGNDLAVQKLSQFKGLYCFTATTSGKSKDFVKSWTSIEAFTNVSSVVSARISSMEKAERSGSAEDGDTNRNITEELVRNLESTFSGVRPTATYWVQWRQYDPDHKKQVLSEYYTGYTLLTVEKKSFDSQVATALQRSVDLQKDVSKEERQMYTNLIKRILEKGLELSE
ncbi:hypothetical protein [Treponema endosymbiont of Eucomonympha sp.]|uniref:hypothetical protein n=1 Tax=Treponema endosymbiont of Eucomonympha sp. TaxID=1580831 RepID=UPI0007513085|nr:hypothetical protein [Treponema endosymbiont of Eucomonympha sp.]